MSNKSSKNKGGVKGRHALYAMVAGRADEIINHLFDTMNNPKAQDSVRMSAANKLIDKILPNLKSTELKNEDGALGFQVIIRDYGSSSDTPAKAKGSVSKES